MAASEAPAEGAASAAPAMVVEDAATTMAVQTTTAGANMMMYHPWLTAAAVAAYATRAMWVKFRQVGLVAQKQRKRLKNRQNKTSREEQDKRDDHDSETETETEAESGSECECEDEDEGPPAVQQDELLKHLQDDPVPNCRSIES